MVKASLVLPVEKAFPPSVRTRGCEDSLLSVSCISSSTPSSKRSGSGLPAADFPAQVLASLEIGVFLEAGQRGKLSWA